MDEITIRELLKRGESQTVEFKEVGADLLPSALFDTICAFLNTEGGIILLGVRDNGEVSGVDTDNIGKLKSDIANLANNPQKLDPVFIIGASEHIVEGKTIIIIQVPVSSMVHRSKGEIFLRNDEGDYRVNQPEIIAGIVNRKLSFFTEQRVYPGIKLSDFNLDLFDRAKFLIRGCDHNHPWLGLSNEEFLQKARLLGKDQFTGKTGYTLAAILLFGSDDLIGTTLPAYKFDALLRRENIDRYDDRLLLRTNIIDTYDRLMEFIEKHLNDPFYLEGSIRVSLREKIFRELVSNIIAHREYTDARPATMAIYSDRVEFKNPNNPNGKGPINPKTFVPRPKNPVISRFMIQLGRAEELGSGITNVTKYLPFYTKGAKASFIEDSMFTTVIPLILAVNMGNKLITTQKTTQKILDILGRNPSATRKEVAQLLGGITVNGVKYHLEKMKKQKIIRRVGSDKGGHWEIFNKNSTEKNNDAFKAKC